MTKAMELGKTSTVGSFHIFLGKTLSTVILAVGAVILGAIIRDTDYGLYAVALIPATTFMLFNDWGVSTALIQRCASCRATNQMTDVRKTILTGLTFEVTTASILTVLSVVLSSFIAVNFFNKPAAAGLIAFASIVIFSTTLAGFAQSVFVGFEKMKIISLTLICQAVLQSTIGPVLVYLGYGAFGALLGFTLASLLTSVVTMVLLYSLVLRKLEKTKIGRSDFVNSLKPLLKYGVPLAIGSILAGGLSQIYSNMMAFYVTDLAQIGNYRVAINFTVLLSFLTQPLTTVLFPAFAKLNPRKEIETIRMVFTSSVKYLSLVLVPAALCIVVLSTPLIGTLYANKWPFAAQFLSISELFALLVVFGSVSIGSLLSAMGETRLIMKTNLVNLLVGVPLAYLLIPILGINGLIIGLSVSSTPSIIICLYFVWKKYGIKADILNSMRILLISTFAAVAGYLSLQAFPGAYWLELSVGVVISFGLYILCIPISGVMNQTDVNNLRTMFGATNSLSKIMSVPLNIIEKMLNSVSNIKQKYIRART